MSSADTDRIIEDPCHTCGAQVRRGLVRCWNCGGFMRQDIAAAYERMRKQKPEVDFRPLPEPGKDKADTARGRAAPASEDDFELSGDSPPASGGSFELGADFSAMGTEKRSGSSSAFSGRGLASAPAAPSKSPDEPKPAEEPTPAKPAAEAAPAPKGEKPRRERPAAAADDEAHSVATAGDALLQVALQEEKENERRGRTRRAAFDPVRVADGWMITCPCPARARIKVKEQHRGKTGKCPNPSCGSYFTVPADLPMPQGDDAAATTAGEAAAGFPADPAEKAGAFTHWLRDVRLHAIKPAKARRKPGGHEKDFQPADLGFSKAAGLLAVSLTQKPAGLLALSKKKPEQVRDETAAALREGKAAGELPAETKLAFEPATLGKLAVEYPPAYEHESTFAGVPVFGEGRIAVKLPPGPAADELHFVSLTLTQYRRLKELLSGLFEQDALGVGCPIPTENDVVTVECRYTEKKLTVLRQPAFYLSDPATPLEKVAYRCESCGLIVSEDGRKKEKIGGLDGKKLASAKCPKCKGKFGDAPFYALKAPEAKPAEAEA